jgi:hypothetical protein
MQITITADDEEVQEGTFPTRVGMNRRIQTSILLGDNVPHARGDEPVLRVSANASRVRSPRAWGQREKGGHAVIVRHIVLFVGSMQGAD